MKRNSSIELYRVGLMFGICLLHAIEQGGYVRRGLDNVMNTCLTGFVFISGYFGIRFRWQKILKLLGIAAYCALPIAVLKTYVFGWDGCFIQYYPSCVRALKVCWFLWSYITLMLLVPIVDPFVEKIKTGKDGILKTLSLFVLVFIWSYAARVPYLKNYIPIDAALLGPALYFLAIYVFARVFAVLEVERYIKTWHLFVGFVFFAFFCWIGFYHMNSPFALGLAVTTFIAFKRLVLPKWLGSVCALAGPSLLSIYIIHTNGAGFELVHRIEHWLFEVVHCPYYIGVIIVASAIFCVCFAADMPRRFFVWVVNGRNIKKTREMSTKIKLFLGAYVNSIQAQCLNCRALAKWLDRDKFTVAARIVYSGDLGVEELHPNKGLKLFKVRYPARIWSWVQFVRGLLWCDIAYLPSHERWKLAKWILRLTGKKGFKTVEGAFIGTNLEKAIAIEGDKEHIARSLTCTGNTYSITKWMRPVNERILGVVTKPTVLYLGVDSEIFCNKVQRDKLTDIAIIGSNLFYKGLNDFFELTKRFSDLTFHVIGSGMGKVSPQDEVNRLDLKNVVCHGSLSHEQLSEVLKSIQLHVFPSRAEGFPKVTLETAAAGVPSVVYDDYGADEWITTGKDGFVVKTIDEMAAVIQDLFNHPEKLQPIADNARAMASRFDWKVRVKEWECEIEKIAKGL